jgi:hypothetical protein
MRARTWFAAPALATLAFCAGAPGCGGGGGGGPPGPPSVLVVYTETLPGWAADVVAKLTAFGVFSSVDPFDGFPATPTLAQLQAYDAVLLLSTACFADPVALGNNLADYVDGGGGVVVSGYGWITPGCETPNGRFLADDYAVIPRGFLAQFDGPWPLVPVNAAHPILSGVVTFGSGTAAARPAGAVVPPGYDLVATFGDPTTTPLVATRLIGVVRRADLGFFPPTQDTGQAGFVDPTTDAMLVVANALRWVSGDL